LNRVRLESIGDIENQLYLQKQDTASKIKEFIAKDHRNRLRKTARRLKNANTNANTNTNTPITSNNNSNNNDTPTAGSVSMFLDNDGDSDGEDVKEGGSGSSGISISINNNNNKDDHDKDKDKDKPRIAHLENAVRLQADLDSDRFELPKDVKAEKRRLMENGFFDLTKRDLKCFLDAVEKYGTSNMPMLISEVCSTTDKSEEFIGRYSTSFFSKLNELPDYVKLVERIERGNKRVAREVEVKNALDLKFSTSSLDDLKIVYGAYRSRIFSDAHDKMLLYLIHKHGYGQWEQIRADIKSSPRFQFDWYFKSRTVIELQRRSETILNLILKEVGGAANKS